MESMRESWTDARLDDLARRMDRGFERVDRDIRDHRSETSGEFASLRSEMNARFDAMEDRFSAIQRAMFQVSCIMIAALLGLIATQL